MSTEVKKIYVLFKTHFDYGYTDLAANIYDRYLKNYIPAALDRADEMRNEGGKRFIWTSGSWLIDEFLQHADEKDRKRMEDAILRGDVRWHGLPFTTHTELMDRELFEYGISLSQKLDKRFGMTTHAAKLTDVPCHTCAVIDPLYDAGITFLHLGNNPTSRAPEIPPLFVWRAASGKEIIVMYAKGYGEEAVIPGTGTMLYFAHTGDNAGPQSADAIRALYRDLAAQYPDAEILGGTLEDIAAEAEKAKGLLPVIEGELGDTWIHGMGTDPKKVGMFRTLLRLRRNWNEKDRAWANRCLIRVPEHTWGSCIDPLMNDRGEYAKDRFMKLRNEERYLYMEKTWKEQRDFVTEVLDGISDEARKEAEEALRFFECDMTTDGGCAAEDSLPDNLQADEARTFSVGGWTVHIAMDGAIDRLEKNGRGIADKTHRIGSFLYEVFSRKETDAYAYKYIETRYHPNLEAISWELWDKPGIQLAIEKYQSAGPVVTGIRALDNELFLNLAFDTPLTEKYGCPRKASAKLTFSADSLQMEYRFMDKDANRVPEGISIGMNPIAENGYKVRKLGEWIDPMRIIEYGNRQMCATDWGVTWDDLSLETLDTALLGFGKPQLWQFGPEQPDLSGGVWFNLFNNMWNTNFPMWYEDDGVFRFVLKLK